MRFSSQGFILASTALGFIAGTAALAVSPARRYPPSLARRQDEAGDEIAPQNTERLRKCKEPRPVYEDQDEVNWYEVDFGKGVLTITKTTDKGENKIGKPKDTKQGSRFVVDHIFELQIITYAFDAANKGGDLAKKIGDKAWQQCHDIVNGLETEANNCEAVAGKITVISNLRGIAERINLLKETIFDRVTYGDKNAALDPKWTDYLPAVKDYLSTTTDDVNKNIQAIGDEIGSLVGDDNVSPYFVDFAKGKWQAGKDYLDGQTSDVMNAAECRLSDECQEDVPTTNDPSAEGINPACKCTCNGQDTPLTDPRCQGFQGLSAPVCVKRDFATPVADAQAIDGKLDTRGDGQQCCGVASGPGCNNVESNGNVAVDLCGVGCIGCAKLANYLQGLIDHCTVDGNVGGTQNINEVPGLTIQI
ncbi:MAG: hypothetical protein Q9218_001918 [Villophora microphyllina]